MNRVYNVSPITGPDNGSVRALTFEEACNVARDWMCTQDQSWCTASCDAIANHIAQDCTIFVGADPVRIALTGTDQCPVPGTGGGGNTGLALALVGLGLVGGLAAVIASQGRKKILVARVRE